tara:strand:+ start:1395 stop:1700 length:306 start_codon:yes stop_codon:yes gene_type:complete
MASWATDYNFPWCMIPKEWFEPRDSAFLTAWQGMNDPERNTGLVRINDAMFATERSTQGHMHTLWDQNGQRFNHYFGNEGGCVICDYLDEHFYDRHGEEIE